MKKVGAGDTATIGTGGHFSDRITLPGGSTAETVVTLAPTTLQCVESLGAAQFLPDRKA